LVNLLISLFRLTRDNWSNWIGLKLNENYLAVVSMSCIYLVHAHIHNNQEVMVSNGFAKTFGNGETQIKKRRVYDEVHISSFMQFHFSLWKKTLLDLHDDVNDYNYTRMLCAFFCNVLGAWILFISDGLSIWVWKRIWKECWLL